ncbi:MAG: DUF2203 domain-containing protein [Candidatus Limnocylindrales bacterium]
MTRFYSIDQADARLRDLAPLLEKLRADRAEVAAASDELLRFRTTNGNAGHAEELKAREDRIRTLVHRMERYVSQLVAWDITLRDIETGLVDFPALVNGRQICLCWRSGEERVGYWHELEAGFGGRRPLIDLA